MLQDMLNSGRSVLRLIEFIASITNYHFYLGITYCITSCASESNSMTTFLPFNSTSRISLTDFRPLILFDFWIYTELFPVFSSEIWSVLHCKPLWCEHIVFWSLNWFMRWFPSGHNIYYYSGGNSWSCDHLRTI